MERFKEYFKLFTYIFYPGVVFILYFAQIVEGNLSTNLIFCPTDLIFVGSIIGVYMLLDAFKVFDKKLFKVMKKDDGKLKLPYMFIFIIILVLLMSLYDDLKVYFYLNNNVSISLLIVAVVWVILFIGCNFLNIQEK
ncbi:hypothetical protein CWE04_02260 [Thomasclavelia cocleata]|uniref:Uncharacterized protein n=1 Tax=Thomasclavelia cocleata TaxID=69824 RepID=A0A1I0ERH2_9FIRM|nr:hypothetical protein [Thomasclavelia cocleata]MCR1961711.1 hypothetical protein [Thomasclavelia cocleata]NDO43113.1 hypothetical protein [Thomasclavelia cocleata]PJN81462.1 hypothetical protein CWE04_02260 [Thomasclavelia cocleata]SET47694.1 hypothetical protein SAMN04489758_11335 [Thomasclavelia cocleata]